jgi:acetolactate synthase I/II/III large subunit
VTLVNNNRSGNQSKRGFDRVYGGEQTDEGRRMWQFTEVNFARIAEEMGAVGIRVDKPGDLAGAIQKAFTYDRPVVLDVTTDLNALAPLAVTG